MVLARTRSSVYFRRSDGLLVREVRCGNHHTLDDAREDTLAFDLLAAGRRQALLIDVLAPFTLGLGVREYLRGEEAGRWLSAAAMVTRSPLHRAFERLMTRLEPPSFACAVFARHDEATAWLNVRERRHLSLVSSRVFQHDG